MKKLLLLPLLLISFKTFACGCMPPNFSDEDSQDAVKRFMQAKMQISENDIMQLDSISYKTFLTAGQRALLGVFSVIEPDEAIQSCEVYCFRGMNALITYDVQYQSGSKVCDVKIYAKMKSSLFSTGYKSVVRRKDYPVCR